MSSPMFVLSFTRPIPSAGILSGPHLERLGADHFFSFTTVVHIPCLFIFLHLTTRVLASSNNSITSLLLPPSVYGAMLA